MLMVEHLRRVFLSYSGDRGLLDQIFISTRYVEWALVFLPAVSILARWYVAGMEDSQSNIFKYSYLCITINFV